MCMCVSWCSGVREKRMWNPREKQSAKPPQTSSPNTSPCSCHCVLLPVCASRMYAFWVFLSFFRDVVHIHTLCVCASVSWNEWCVCLSFGLMCVSPLLRFLPGSLVTVAVQSLSGVRQCEGRRTAVLANCVHGYVCVSARGANCQRAVRLPRNA